MFFTPLVQPKYDLYMPKDEMMFIPWSQRLRYDVALINHRVIRMLNIRLTGCLK
jgi:hypothetical protein